MHRTSRGLRRYYRRRTDTSLSTLCRSPSIRHLRVRSILGKWGTDIQTGFRRHTSGSIDCRVRSSLRSECMVVCMLPLYPFAPDRIPADTSIASDLRVGHLRCQKLPPPCFRCYGRRRSPIAMCVTVHLIIYHSVFYHKNTLTAAICFFKCPS